MPIYDCRCRGCDKTHDPLVRPSSAPACPACGGRQLEKLPSRPAQPGRSAEIVSRARSQAAREGHFSSYGAS